MGLLFSETKMQVMSGLLIGKVMSNYDKDRPGMVQVQIQTYQEGFDKLEWMRVMSPTAGKKSGFYFCPDVGDEVLVGFIAGDIDNPCVLGCLWNEQNDYPNETLQEKNTVKKIVTKAGCQILFKEEDKKESIQINTPKGLKILLDDEKKSLMISDSGGKNSVSIDAEGGKITIKADTKIVLDAKDIALTAKNGVQIEGNEVKASAKNQVSLEGKAKVAIEGAQVEAGAKGTLTLKSSGITEIKGSMVKING